MTFEKKCLVEVGDIVAVRYECSNCNAANVVPITKLDPERLASMCISVCSFCQTPFGFQLGSIEMGIFSEFNASLRRIAEIMAGRNLKIRLELKTPE
jgi:formate dehydrogenase maturation protein FdhE